MKGVLKIRISNSRFILSSAYLWIHEEKLVKKLIEISIWYIHSLLAIQNISNFHLRLGYALELYFVMSIDSHPNEIPSSFIFLI